MISYFQWKINGDIARSLNVGLVLMGKNYVKIADLWEIGYESGKNLQRNLLVAELFV